MSMLRAIWAYCGFIPGSVQREFQRPTVFQVVPVMEQWDS